MKTTSRIILTALALTASAVLGNAQQTQNPDRQRGGDRGNPEEFRQRMAERLKTALKVSDEEWGVISPLIEKVQTKQRDALSGRFGGFGGRGGPGGGGGGGDRGGTTGATGGDQARPGATESTALRTALESESTSPEDLKAKLAAVREVRKKNAAELAAARTELQKVVTVRQEAVLVSMGILE
jgi:hypothetical protein